MTGPSRIEGVGTNWLAVWMQDQIPRCHGHLNGEDRVGHQGLHAIKGRLYNGG